MSPEDALITIDICRHCQRNEATHAEGHCLFESKTFQPYTRAEWFAVNRGEHAASEKVRNMWLRSVRKV